MLNILVHDKPVSMGLQSVLFVPTLDNKDTYNGGVHVALLRAWSSTCQYRVTSG